MANNRGRARRHRARATGRAYVYPAGGARRSRYQKTPKRRGLGPNARAAAKAKASKGLGNVVAAADTASSLHAGILAVGAAYGTAKAGQAYLRRRRRRSQGPRRDSQGKFT